MKTYEITFITKEDLKDKPVKTVLDGLSGKILNISSLGQKTFTYPIKKEKSGFYTTVNFEIEPEKVVDFNRKLALEEEILRFLIVSATPTVQTALLPKRTKEVGITKEPEKIVEAEPEKEIVVEEKPKKIAKEKPKKVPAFAKATADKSKVVKELIEEPVSEEERLDALDKKLEELLKE